MGEEFALPLKLLTEDAIAPYGWLLGRPFPGSSGSAYQSPGSDFWQEHVFNPGSGGQVEVLWVSYRNNDPVISSLEAHLLTEQAVVPLNGEIIQALALSDSAGQPDLSTLSAFRVRPGMGVCMKPGTWHATRSASSTCMMLTRQSTTLDLVRHLVGRATPVESAIQTTSPIRLLLDE